MKKTNITNTQFEEFKESALLINTALTLIEKVDQDHFVDTFGMEFKELDEILEKVYHGLKDSMNLIKDVGVLKETKMKEFL